MTDFEYDVAFSFHSLDEPIAIQLNDVIQDRFKTFLYLEQQKLLAGRDGEQAFNVVFQEKARVVVVFYRKEWGQTPFTRIEETAIRNRAFGKGFDFSLFIPTDKPPTSPPWLPRTRLYFAMDRFGLSGAAGVVEQLVQENGGEPRSETLADRAARFERAEEFRREQKEFINSEVSVKAATEAFVVLADKIEGHVNDLKASGTHLAAIRSVRKRQAMLLTAIYPNLLVEWNYRISNSLDESSLTATYYSGFPGFPGYNPPFDKARKVHELKLDYRLLRPKVPGYLLRGSDRNFSPEELAEFIVKSYVDIADKGKG